MRRYVADFINIIILNLTFLDFGVPKHVKSHYTLKMCHILMVLLQVSDCPNAPEFTAYRLLYSIAMSNSKDVTTILRSLTPAMREEKCVAYALKVRNKLTMGDQVCYPFST